MSPSTKIQTTPSTSKRRGRRANQSGRNNDWPAPRRTIRALAMLVNVAAAQAQLLPPAPEPLPFANQFNQALVLNAVDQPDLNIPPAEPLEASEQPQEQLPALAPALQPLMQQLPPGGIGIPFFYALQQAQGGGGIPQNFNGGLSNYNIRVRSTNLPDHGVHYTMEAAETMYRIYSDYASRVNLLVHHIVFKRHDVIVPSMSTAFAAGIRDSDILCMVPQNSDYNVDTRFKRFVVQDCHSNPRELRVNALPNATLYETYEMWGAQNDVDTSNMIGIHNNEVVTTLHTIAKAGIKNQDWLIILPNNWKHPGLVFGPQS